MPTQEFNVKLDGITLDAQARARLQNGISQLVLSELARVDNRGDLVFTRPIKIGPIINGIIARVANKNIQIDAINR